MFAWTSVGLVGYNIYQVAYSKSPRKEFGVFDPYYSIGKYIHESYTDLIDVRVEKIILVLY